MAKQPSAGGDWNGAAAARLFSRHVLPVAVTRPLLETCGLIQSQRGGHCEGRTLGITPGGGKRLPAVKLQGLRSMGSLIGRLRPVTTPARAAAAAAAAAGICR